MAAIRKKLAELNVHLLPPAVKIVPHLNRSDLLNYTTHKVLHNLMEGIVLVAVILFPLLRKCPRSLHRRSNIPFSLLFVSICLDVNKIPASLVSLAALDFGIVAEGAVVMVENIIRYLARRNSDSRPSITSIREAAHEIQRPVSYSIGIIITAIPVGPPGWDDQIKAHFHLFSALLHAGFMAPPKSQLSQLRAAFFCG